MTRFQRRTLARAYELLWLVVAAVVSLVASVAALGAFPLLALVVWTGAWALAGAGCYWLVVHELDPDPVALRGDRLLLATLAAGSVSWVLVGLNALAGTSGLVALVVLVALWPGTVRALRHRAPWPRSSPTPVPPAALTTEQLCHAWCVSFTALSDASTAAERLQVVLLRRRFLEELEHRDPAGFATWLTRGAGAASDPGPYVGRLRPGG